MIPDNACILRITAAAGTELADAFSSGTVNSSSLTKEVYNPKAFFPHAVLLRQAFAHCGKFPTAASRRSLGPCLSPSVAAHPLRPATDHCLGRLLPSQLANRTRAPLSAINLSLFSLSGISTSFLLLSPSLR